MRKPTRRLSAVLCAIGAVALAPSCDSNAPATKAVPVASTLPAAPAPKSPAELCRERLRQLERAPAQPGAPGLQKRRADVLARAKAEPVIFKRAPRAADSESVEVRLYRKQLAESPSPAWTLHRMYSFLKNRHELARDVLLREGYLYAEQPALAAALVDKVELHHLFTEPELVIQRGTQLLHAKRGKLTYVYEDGPEAGRRARILLFDRVWARDRSPGPALHVAVRSLATRQGFDRMRLRRIANGSMLADLRYGAVWVPAVLTEKHGELALECELVPAADRERVTAARERTLRHRRALSAKRRAIVAMIEERLPFDEPITEEGQQDGNLRPAWKWAYDHGWDSFTFNDDHYLVFDGHGRPKVPQVCIDFVTDTFERASGTWWKPRAEGRERTRGAVDFDALGIENRRSVDVFIRFAKERPEWFDVYELASEERVRFYQRSEFFAHLAEHADRYVPGDIVAIFGPRDDGENHWHSFFVYDADPVTGVPMLLASNAGFPRIRSWEGEMRPAPLRSIHTRIRPRLEWLEQVLAPAEVVSSADPAPLISAPI
jgi:hypothetical protein